MNILIKIRRNSGDEGHKKFLVFDDKMRKFENKFAHQHNKTFLLFNYVTNCVIYIINLNILRR